MSTYPVPSARRRSSWVLVTTVGLVTLVVGGLVVGGLVVLATGVIESFRGASPAPYQKLVDSAPVPPGAVRTGHQASTGFDSGPYASDTFRLAAGTTLVVACPAVLSSLRDAGWVVTDAAPAGACHHTGRGAGFSVHASGSTQEVDVSLVATGREVDLTYSAY